MSPDNNPPGDPDSVNFDPFTPPTLEELNTLIPSYEFVAFIDRGGMGAVYKAVQKSLGRIVAVKILPQAQRNRQRFAERFAREARALALLNHRHIVSVYDSGETQDGHMYYAMEFVAGTDLCHLLHQQQLTPRQILTIVTQVCEALQFAHDRGVVHRDIKPANILIDESGNVKVADFGLAKVTGRAGDGSKPTATNTALGTADYIAPEAMTREIETDHRADIYSLGVMIYEMLTGHVPKGAWEPPSICAGADVQLDDVVSKAMQPDPEKRFQHVSDMTQIIQKLLRIGEELTGFDLPRPFPKPRRPAGPSADAPTVITGDGERSWGKRALLAGLGVTAVLATAFIIAKQQTTPDTKAAPVAIATDGLSASPTSVPTAAPAQQALATWVFERGGFVNAAKPGSTDRVMGDAADLRSQTDLPSGPFAIWRINVTRDPLPNDAAFHELIDLCVKAGTVENLNLRNSSVRPASLQRLQELDLLTNIDLTGSTAVTESSVPHIAGCTTLKLFRFGGSVISDASRIAEMLRNLRPECEFVVE